MSKAIPKDVSENYVKLIANQRLDTLEKRVRFYRDLVNATTLDGQSVGIDDLHRANNDLGAALESLDTFLVKSSDE